MSYKFSTTKSYDSTVLPGVRLVLRKMTENRRLKLQMAIGAHNNELRSKVLEQARLREAKDQANTARILAIDDEINVLITEKINPEKIRWAVSAISGLTLDDSPATIDNVMDWPSDLIQELITLVDDGSALNEVEQKNSASPTTSGALTVGRENSSSATSVGDESTNGSKPETAKSTILN